MIFMQDYRLIGEYKNADSAADELFDLSCRHSLVVCPRTNCDDWFERLIHKDDVHVCRMWTERGYEAFKNPTAPCSKHIGIIDFDTYSKHPAIENYAEAVLAENPDGIKLFRCKIIQIDKEQS